MKKLLITCILLILVSTTVWANESNNQLVIIDDISVEYTKDTGYPFFTDDQTLYLPFIKTLEAYGAKIRYFEASKVIVANKGLDEVGCLLNEKSLIKHNLQFIGDNARCIIKDNIVYFPALKVFNALGTQASTKDNSLYIKTKDYEIKLAERSKPGLDISAPKHSTMDTESIQITTDADATLYINAKPVTKTDNNTYNVAVGKTIYIRAYRGKIATKKSVYIHKTKDDIFLEIDDFRKNTNSDIVSFTGKAKYNSTLTFNGKDCPIEENESFIFRYNLKDGSNKIIVKCIDPNDSDNIIKKTFKYNYDENAHNKDNSNNYYKDKDSVHLYENENTSNKGNENNKDDTSSDNNNMEKPIFHFENPLPSSTDKKVIIIKGYCDNAETVWMSGCGSSPIKLKAKYGDRIEFEHTVILHGKNSGYSVTSDGVYNFFQIVGTNSKYTTHLDVQVYYTGDE